ncbi:Actin-related protein 4 [Vermiconidia calcicola]|uniref:Actin-related protein 4 n=1 Tax=Vermiconidia calcicola TaxID=1690605 RepID=A0ACC3MKU9_9PEZI|nr:Actin-related protein 4 [Vermiconidia calcicola]
MASAMPPTQAPANAEYAGDEINALVLDPGSYTTRAGFAGEDTPKSVVPTSYGSLPSGERLFGENAIHLPRPDMEIRNPYNSDGIVEDWDTAARLWEYSITSRLTGAKQTPPTRNGLNDRTGPRDENGDVEMEMEQAEDQQEQPLAEFPLLMSEAPWNPTKAREKTMEIAMEEWGVPAFFLAKTGQLAAYSQGKATALVVDVGHRNTSVTALWEGMVLRKSIFHTHLAGSWLNSQIRAMFATLSPPVPLVPHYMVQSKQPVDANTPSAATYTTFSKPPTASFRQLEEDRVLTSFKESVVQAWQGPGRLDSPSTNNANNNSSAGYTNVDYAKGLPPKPFEMPDGWNSVFGIERFKVAEGLFDHRAAYPTPTQPELKGESTLPSLLSRSLQACDVETRAPLLNNVILTGAGSLIEKLPERLQSDLQTMFPNPKVRVLANSSAPERKFGSWVGGSVLGSLGTFHQMWVSRQEYGEFGAGIVEKRCK